MSEATKTGVFGGVAGLVIAFAAFATWPPTYEDEANRLIGKSLFPKFDDPMAAASLKIVSYRAGRGARSFEVQKDADGVWSLPTHSGYPADAEAQMRNAANGLLGLTILEVSTLNAEDHESYGVLEPRLDEKKLGYDGMGRLVSFRDPLGTNLVTLIIGKKVSGSPGQRYVRIPTQDAVYVCEIDDHPFTTRFTDWIDKDLLGLNLFDIKQISLHRYTASIAATGRILENHRFYAAIAPYKLSWILVACEVFRDGTRKPKDMGPNEELNRARLNLLKSALDRLEIAAVLRKPKGISARLQVGQPLSADPEELKSLLHGGFLPRVQKDGSPSNILGGANGEMMIVLKNGIRYVLRFGNPISQSNPEQANSEKKNEDAHESLRFLLVTADVDSSQIPIPDLQEIPDTIEQLDGIEMKTTHSSGLATLPSERQSKAESDSESETSSTQSESAGSVPDDSESSTDTTLAPEEEETAQEKQERLEAIQEKIRKRNERLMNEREEQLEKAGRQARILNARFANWYYLISEKTYKNLMLDLDDLFISRQNMPTKADSLTDP